MYEASGCLIVVTQSVSVSTCINGFPDEGLCAALTEQTALIGITAFQKPTN